jgi:hypothetical protein
MKSKFTIMQILICVAALFAAVQTTSAQQYQATSLTLSGNSINGSATSTENATVVLTKQDIVALALTAQGGNAGQAGNVTASFSASVDGSSWQSAYTTVVVAASGNTAVTTVSPVTVGAIGYLRLASIQNSSNGAITPTVKVSVKPKRNGS